MVPGVGFGAFTTRLSGRAPGRAVLAWMGCANLSPLLVVALMWFLSSGIPSGWHRLGRTCQGPQVGEGRRNVLLIPELWLMVGEDYGEAKLQQSEGSHHSCLPAPIRHCESS